MQYKLKLQKLYLSKKLENVDSGQIMDGHHYQNPSLDDIFTEVVETFIKLWGQIQPDKQQDNQVQ